jgi:hypothetical protein
MNRKIGLLLSGSLAVCLVAGCNVAQLETEIKETIAAMDLVKKVNSQAADEKPIIVSTILDLRKNDLAKEARALLDEGNYAEIEKRMAQYRSSREEFLDGKSKLEVFYSGLADMRRNGTDAEWQKLEKRLLDWRKKHPKSVTAQVALAMTYYDGAHLARGNEFSNKVKPEQWELMQQRLDRGVEALTAAIPVKAQCPGWYLAAIDLLFLEGVEREAFDAVVNEGVARFPHMTNFHISQVHYLMDRWYGEPGDWQEYASRIADTKKGDDGDILYARCVWFLITMVDSRDAPELQEFDWARAKRGFEQLILRPESHAASGAFAVAAWLKRDRATLKQLFEKQIGNHIDFAVWRSTDQFKEARKWALG